MNAGTSTTASGSVGGGAGAGAGVGAAEPLPKKEKGLGNLDEVCIGEPRAPGRGGRGGFTCESGRCGNGKDEVYVGTENIGYGMDGEAGKRGKGDREDSAVDREDRLRRSWYVLLLGRMDDRKVNVSLQKYEYVLGRIFPYFTL
jgi:hypothetical protein